MSKIRAPQTPLLNACCTNADGPQVSRTHLHASRWKAAKKGGRWPLATNDNIPSPAEFGRATLCARPPFHRRGLQGTGIDALFRHNDWRHPHGVRRSQARRWAMAAWRPTRAWLKPWAWNHTPKTHAPPASSNTPRPASCVRPVPACHWTCDKPMLHAMRPDGINNQGMRGKRSRGTPRCPPRHNTTNPHWGSGCSWRPHITPIPDRCGRLPIHCCRVSRVLCGARCGNPCSRGCKFTSMV